jgi:flagellar protein FliO/FliZ
VRVSGLCVASVALGVSILTSPTLARADADIDTYSTIAPTGSARSSDENPPPALSSSPASQQSTTPLALRPSQPTVALRLSDESSNSSLGWKLVALMLVIGAVVYGLRRRTAPRPTSTDLVIARRASLGLRSELIVVNVDGQRLLLGVTPHSIHTLAVLDSADESPSPVSAATAEPFARESPLEAMLDSTEDVRPNDRPVKRSARPKDDQIPGQARGLASLRRRR